MQFEKILSEHSYYARNFTATEHISGEAENYHLRTSGFIKYLATIKKKNNTIARMLTSTIKIILLTYFKQYGFDFNLPIIFVNTNKRFTDFSKINQSLKTLYSFNSHLPVLKTVSEHTTIYFIPFSFPFLFNLFFLSYITTT